jgi:modulator of FtsH protease HflC
VSNLRRVLGNQEFATLLTEERAVLMNRIRDAVGVEAQKYGVEIIDVRIKRADLPANVSAQVFNRMQTQYKEQASERRATGKEEADRIRGDAERQTADGDAVRIFAEAYGRDASFFEFYRSMQAYRVTIGKDDTTMVLSPDSEFLKYLNEFEGKRR